MSTTTEIELPTRRSQDTPRTRQQSDSSTLSLVAEEPGPESSNITSAIPDGGYGWVVVLSCSWITFLAFGLSGAWGVVQTALLESSLDGSSTSTVTFIGSLGLALVVALSLLGTSLMRLVGARVVAMAGILLLGIGEIASGWTNSSVGGLFGTSGLLVGMGTCLCYAITNSLPTQYFSGKLGLANGIVKGGGGLGSTVFAIALEALIKRLGIPWMFRVLGVVTLATGLPAAWLIKERSPPRNVPFVDFSLFRSLAFNAVFLASAIGTFSLWIPPYFLPIFARSAGSSSGTGAGLVAGFNACTALGRFAAGPVCDRMGPLNTFFFIMVLNALSVLAIWTVSDSLGPLIVFAIINGISNGAFFTTLPTVVASMVGPGLAVVAMSMNVTGWTAGYLLGTPIAGYLLEASGADKATSVDPYRPAILYAGLIAFVSGAFVLLARLKLDRRLAVKL